MERRNIALGLSVVFYTQRYLERQALNLAQKKYYIWSLIYFKESQYIEFYRLSHMTSKMDTCDHGYIPTCMFGNKENPLSNKLAPQHHMRVLDQQDALR